MIQKKPIYFTLITSFHARPNSQSLIHYLSFCQRPARETKKTRSCDQMSVVGPEGVRQGPVCEGTADNDGGETLTAERKDIGG